MPNTSVQAELQMPSMMTRSLAVADARVLGLVFLDIAAMIARDVQIGARRVRSEQEDSRARGVMRMGRTGHSKPLRTREAGPSAGPSLKTLAGLCWDFVKHRGTAKN